MKRQLIKIPIKNVSSIEDEDILVYTDSDVNIKWKVVKRDTDNFKLNILDTNTLAETDKFAYGNFTFSEIKQFTSHILREKKLSWKEKLGN